MEAPRPQPRSYNLSHNLNFTPQGASALPPPQVYYQVHSRPLRVNNTVPISTAQANSRSQVNQPTLVLIKPRDIKVLELEALQCIDSSARLQMFFEAVKQCTDDFSSRLDVAKSRVDGDLAVMIQTAQKQGDIRTWQEFKSFLTREFGMEMNFDQAWSQNDTFHYDWMDSPHSFVQQFKCH